MKPRSVSGGALLPMMLADMLIPGDRIYPVLPQSEAAPGVVKSADPTADGGVEIELTDGRRYEYAPGRSVLGAWNAAGLADAG